jgi:hypothetical protein
VCGSRDLGTEFSDILINDGDDALKRVIDRRFVLVLSSTQFSVRPGFNGQDIGSESHGFLQMSDFQGQVVVVALIEAEKGDGLPFWSIERPK